MLRAIISIIFGFIVMSSKGQYQICYVFEAEEIPMTKLDSNVLKYWYGRNDSMKLFFNFNLDDSVYVFFNQKLNSRFYVKHDKNYIYTRSLIFPKQTDSHYNTVEIIVKNKYQIYIVLKEEYNSILVDYFSSDHFNICYRKGVVFNNGHQTKIW